jgi:hypothetical protein
MRRAWVSLGAALCVFVAIILGTLLAPNARADILWMRRGTDPLDVPCLQGPQCLGFDVQSTALRIVRVDDGRRLIVRLRSYERNDLNEDWKSLVALDTRAGLKEDRLVFLNIPLGAKQPGVHSGCGVRRPAQPGSEWRMGVYRLHQNGKVATCRLPLRWFAPDKRPIRWHVTTDNMFPEPASLIDHAPDHGWYP